MNVFVLDLDPKKCAEYHNDKHVIKMILEHVQMMCCVHHLQIEAKMKLAETEQELLILEALKARIPYMPTHRNHPCTVWLRESIQNWIWLMDLTIHLNIEYKKRYNRDVDHASIDVMTDLDVPELPNNWLTPFAQAMPEEYRNEDAVKAYRDYYMGEKRDISTWRTQTPKWFKEIS